MKVATHHLRCTECAAVIPKDEASSNFRCPQCNGLYEVVYPWSDVKPGAKLEPKADAQSGTQTATFSDLVNLLPNPSALRWLWQERRTSTMAVDQSGVWRFRDLLPIVDDFEKVVTLREGNTPLYELPRAARALGLNWLLAKHQGMNPTGSFKDTGMTAALSVAAQRGFEWVACASTGNTSAAMAAYAARAGLRSIVFIPEGKIAWGKLSQSMDYGALTIQLKTDFDGCVGILADARPALSHLSAELRQSLPTRRPEDPRLRDRRAARLAGARAHHRSGWQPRELRRSGQGLHRDVPASASSRAGRRSASSRLRAPILSTAGSSTPIGS